MRQAKVIAAAGAWCGLAGAAMGQAGPGGETAITIYSSATPGAIPAEMYRPVPGMGGGYQQPGWWSQIPGYALVRRDVTMDLPKGRGTVKFNDVAALIEPTTVTFTPGANAGGASSARVLDQSYQFDLVSSDALLNRFIDKPITVEQAAGDKVQMFTGTLMSSSWGNLVLRMEDGRIRMVNGYANVQFPSLPDGLITKPTLVWDVTSEAGGATPVRVTYQTNGITWWADYNLVFAEGKDANSGVLDVGAWVSVLNKSGAGYADAKLKLIAGDVHRAPASQSRSMALGAMMEMRKAGEEAGFEEKSFFEYHLYTLGRPATIPENSTKQIELFEKARGVPCEKVMVYYGLDEGYRGFFASPMTDREFGTQSNKKVDLYLQFKNSKESGMGMPLPSGRIRVSKLDSADGSLEFIGEDVIDHTPKDEHVLIKMGSAFDVVGERKQTDFKADSRGHWIEETIEIKVRNHKAEPVKVIVKENMYRWSNWEIIRKSTDFHKIDSRTAHFPITVEKDGEATVTYTVRYTW